jgi:sec-independent protein translocase protein TatC
MASPDEPRGADAPRGETAQDAAHEPHVSDLPVNGEQSSYTGPSYSDSWSSAGPLDTATLEQTAALNQAATSPAVVETAKPSSRGGAGSPPKPPDPPDEDDEEDGMARMSFLEHLEELRKRLLLGIGGIGVAFFLCLFFSDQLWSVVFEPAGAALRALHVVPPTLKLINPMDSFQIMWMKIPILAAVFLSSPWLLYQVWAFISPGLYKRERRWAAPFVISSAGLFIVGGLFAYFVAFRFGLEFLLGLGIGKGVDPSVNITEYYDLFVDVMLGVGVIFEIPVLLFLLTLIHVASPAFLIRHSRYAILVIVVLAAVITPTGDVFNLALFATPMIILFYIGIFASYILVLHREKRRFPWGTFFKWFLIGLVVLAVAAWGASVYYGYHFAYRWPFFVR